MQKFLEFKDMDLNDGSALEFVGFKVTNSALVLYNQFHQAEQQRVRTVFKFMLALRKFPIQSISKGLLWKQWETITPNKHGKLMCVHRFARALYKIQSKLIDKQGCKSSTDEVKIRKFLHNIPNISMKSITPHLTDHMTYNNIVTKSEQFEAVNRVANVEHTKPGYTCKVSRYSHATSTRSNYTTQQTRPDNGQPQ